MPLPLIAAGIATGLVGAIGKMFGRGKANRQMNSLLARDPTYAENPIARQRMSLAQMLLNARMPGAASAERNILENQANKLYNVNRNATDASQAIAAAQGVGAQTDQAFTNLGIDEANDYQRRLSNLNQAQEGLIAEGDKVFGDQIRRFGNEFQVRAAQNENRQNTWGDISNFGFSLANMGATGLFNSNGRDRHIRGISIPPTRTTGILSGMPSRGSFAIGNLPTPQIPRLPR